MMTREQPWHLRNTDYSQDREFEDLREISRLHHAVAEAARLKLSLLELSQASLLDLLVESSATEFLTRLRTELVAEELTLLSLASGQDQLDPVWEAARHSGAEGARRRWPALAARPASVEDDDVRHLMSCFRDSPFSKSILIRRATARELRMSFLEGHAELRSELRSRLRFEWTSGYLSALQPALRVSAENSTHPDELKWEI